METSEETTPNSDLDCPKENTQTIVGFKNSLKRTYNIFEEILFNATDIPAAKLLFVSGKATGS